MKPILSWALLFSLTALLSAPSFAAIEGVNLITGKSTKLEIGPKGTVLIFMSARCPCSHSHVPEVKKLALKYADFSFAVVHANADEPTEEAKAYFQEAGFLFPVIHDQEGKLAEEFKALKTPHAFLINSQGKILYKGGITNSNDSNRADKHFLQNSLAEIVDGKSISNPEGRTLGCVIARGKNGK